MARQMENLENSRQKFRDGLPELFRKNIGDRVSTTLEKKIISSTVQKLKVTARMKRVVADKLIHWQFSYEHCFEFELKIFSFNHWWNSFVEKYMLVVESCGKQYLVTRMEQEDLDITSLMKIS